MNKRYSQRVSDNEEGIKEVNFFKGFKAELSKPLKYSLLKTPFKLLIKPLKNLFLLILLLCVRSTTHTSRFLFRHCKLYRNYISSNTKWTSTNVTVSDWLSHNIYQEL